LQSEHRLTVNAWTPLPGALHIVRLQTNRASLIGPGQCSAPLKAIVVARDPLVASLYNQRALSRIYKAAFRDLYGTIGDFVRALRHLVPPGGYLVADLRDRTVGYCLPAPFA